MARKTKDLFDNKYPSRVAMYASKNLVSSSAEEIGREVESPAYTKSFLEDKERFKPNVDFSDPSNFVTFGSAQEYYKNTIENIYKTYPYDGSFREKYDWHNSSSYFDNYFFEYEYPKTNGYISIGQNWTTDSTAADDGVDKIVVASSPQYISIKGGPNGPQAPSYDLNYEKEITFKNPEQKANFFNSIHNQKQNLTIDGTNGNTVEFWLKLPTNSATGQNSPSYAYFDLWNESTDKTSGGEYGRFLIETRLDKTLDGTYTDDSLFHVTYMSGTAGAERAPVGPTSLLTSQNITLSDWNHYAFVVENNPTGSDHLLMNLYINGTKVTTVHTGSQVSEVIKSPFNANLGAYRYNPASNLSVTNGEGSISGSYFDEFRFWKKTRNQKQISQNWFTQVAGGTNTDVGTADSKYSGSANIVDLGVYYKFNEGIVGSTQDSLILDYSGRVSNGTYNNYSISSLMPALRSTSSAMVESNAAATEFKDPIIYSNHSSVSNLYTESIAKGVEYDVRNSMGLYNSMPMWILDDDAEKNNFTLKKLTQIMGSFFDELHIQTKQINKLKDEVYLSGSLSGSAYKPLPFANRLLESRGFMTSELFSDASILESLANRNEVKEFKTELVNVKNQIYTNIYNNLNFITKAKGTEKSIRNLLRCYGVDDNIYALSFYANNADITLNQSVVPKTIRKNYVNFATASNFNALVYQSTASSATNESMYLTGSGKSGGFDAEIGFTLESEVIFPLQLSDTNPRKGETEFTAISASLFGMHTVPIEQSDEGDTVWSENDYANFQVYAVREFNQNTPETNSLNKIKFVLTGTNVNSSTEASVPFLTSSAFYDVYNNEKWNFAVKIYPTKYPNAGFVSGSTEYKVEFHGINPTADIIQNNFVVTGTVSNGTEFLTSKKRVYIGAHRTNFTGSVLQTTNVRMSSCRYWAIPLETNELVSHAIDASNYGVFNPERSAFLFQNYGVNIPKIRTLALNWDFSQNTGSNASGEFTVQDFSSGSGESVFRGDLSDLLLKSHTGRGVFFGESRTDTIKKEKAFTYKQQVPENLDISDTIKIINKDQEFFNSRTRPVSFSFSAEKSMYQSISEEMLNFLACSAESSGLENLVGDPVNKYRPNYKMMQKVRSIFFERISNTPDLDKFLEYYKWLDGSVEYMIDQLVPASSQIDGVRNIVESHVLERNKFQHKFPTFEFGSDDPEAIIKGAGELSYNWKYGHAPINLVQNNNCNWWNKKVDREDPILAIGNSGVDVSRATIHSASLQVFNRRFNAPYKLTAEEGGGIVKTSYNKRGVVLNQINAFDTANNITFNTTTLVSSSVNCSDDTQINPNLKRKADYQVELSDNTNTKTKYSSGLVSPYSFYSASIAGGVPTGIPTGYQVGPDHLRDYYVDTKDVPMQSPFTERHVGGHAYRHVGVNTTNQQPKPIPQAWFLTPSLVGSNLYYTIYNPSFFGSSLTRADFSRETLAKRPVNIRNIQSNTSSVTNDYGALIPLGNYTHNYEIVQIADRSTNSRYFVENNGLSTASAASPTIFGLRDFSVPDRGRHASIMVNRFSAPGGPEVNGAGYLDYESETFSVYNALPFRNLTVRQPLNSFLTKHSAFGGYDSEYGSPSASYHKTQRNGAKRIISSSAGPRSDNSGFTTGSEHDNYWVQHTIPRSDLSYSWITASATNVIFGYEKPNLANASLASTDLTFVSASDFGVFGTSTIRYGMPRSQAEALGSTYVQSFIPVDFVGLNTIFVPTIDAPNNTITSFDLSPFVPGNFGDGLYGAVDLNAQLLNLNGAGGFSSWRQVRQAYNPIVRNMVKANTISIVTSSVVSFVNGDPRISEDPFNVTEPVLFSSHRPIKHHFILDSGEDLFLRSTYGNNLQTFANPKINSLINFKVEMGKQIYDDLTKIYIENAVSTFSPIEEFVGLDYREVVFPRRRHSSLAKTRTRENYTVSRGDSNFDFRIGDSVAFWKDNIDNRLRTNDRAINASSDVIQSASYPSRFGGLFGMIDLSIWPLDAEEPFFDYYMYSASAGDAEDQGFDPYAWVPMDTSTASRTLNPEEAGGDRWKNLSKNGELSNASYIYGIYDYAIGGKDETLSDPKALRSGALPKFQTSRRVNVRPSGSLQFEYPNLVWSGSFPYGQRFNDAFNENGGTTSYREMTVECSASLHLIPPYRADVLSGRRPWYDSYEEYSKDIKLIAKEYSILPEFRISEHMEYYLDQGFFSENNKFLDLVGCSLSNTSSADTETSPFQNQFFKIYSNSDFMSHFVEIKKDHKKGKVGLPSRIKLKINGVKKLLPYNGFYPALRSVQLGSMFSASYGPNISGSFAYDRSFTENTRLAALYQPFFAPGVFFNTIKSGIAVDYPVHTGSAAENLNDIAGGTFAELFGVDTQYSCSTLALGIVASDPNYVFPFEAIINPDRFIPLTASQDQSTFDDVLAKTGYASGSVFFTYPHFTASLDVANAAAGAIDPWMGNNTSNYAKRPEHFFTWNGESDPKYSLAANNFFAEVENFFLERKAPTSFVSKAEKDFKPMKSGSVYMMDVVLSKTDNFISYEGPSGSFNFIPFTGSALQYPLSISEDSHNFILGLGRHVNNKVGARGMHYGPPYLPQVKALGTIEGGQAWFEDPCFAPHTPPYFYGDAVARIEFRPHVYEEMPEGGSRKFSLQDILAGVEIKYFNTNKRAPDFANRPSMNSGILGELGPVRFPAFRNQMQISSSVDLIGSVTLKQTQYSSQQDQDGNFIADGLQTTVLQDSQDAWVIESKFECPSINMVSMDVESLGADFGNGNEKYYTRGIWKGYGEPPTGSDGIHLRIRESMAQRTKAKTFNLTGSLIDVCGFRADKVRIGELASERQISEAIVAIPINPQGEFYKIDPAMFLQQVINLDKGDPAIKKDQFGATTDIQTTSISRMIQKMKKFYIPPQFDPLKNGKAEPIVMYIFDFTHNLSKTDLSYIWQNLMPDIAMSAEKVSSTIEHDLRSKFEFFGSLPDPGGALSAVGFDSDAINPFVNGNSDVRWMVFKAKQRGKNNYTNVTKKSEVSSGFSFTSNKELASFTSSPDKELPYSYNWPYDFFSLIELAQLESEVKFRKAEISEQTPPTTSGTPTVDTTTEGGTTPAAQQPQVFIDPAELEEF